MLGVNRPAPQKLPLEKWQQTIDAMAASGVRHLRRSLSPADEDVERMVAYANQRGIEVVFVISTWVAEFYPETVQPRPSNGNFFAARGLSKLDIARFAAFWHDHRRKMRQAGVKVFAYQLGNEINGPGFNGDFPIGSGARLLSAADCDHPTTCADIRAGFSRYVDMLQLMRESGELDEALLIAAGMAYATPAFVRNSEGYFLPVEAANAYLDTLGASRYVDAYAVQVYPWVPDAAPEIQAAAIRRWLGTAIDQCLFGGVSQKPCWITEWGFPSTVTCGADAARNRLHLDALHYLQSVARERPLHAAFYFDWDQNLKFDIFRCGQLAVNPVIVR